MGRGGQRAEGLTSEVVARIEQAPEDARRRLLMEWAATKIAAFLGWDGPEDVGPDDHFVDDLGFDSLRAVDFKDVIEAELAVSIRTTALFDQPTPRHLVDWLFDDVLFDAESAAAEASRQAAGAPLAVVGMACRLPGGANSPEEFWQLLRDGVDAITEIPSDRWPVDRLYDPDPAAPGRMTTRYGGFVDEIDRFDAAFFGLSPREAVQLDPQHRLLLETTWEAIEDAGIDAHSLSGTDAGVFIGMRASEYFDSQCDRGPLDGNQYYATGNAMSTAAGRISYFLGLEGPSFAVDTACSGSLVALHLAAGSLRKGECRVAICGGVNAILDAVGTISLSKAGMLSPDGRCKTFDASANGYARAEGCGVVVLKKLADARADGDRIIGVIRGVAINQDGASGGLTVPSGRAQESVIRAALADGGLRPGDIQYVEAHGTGTPLGDPIELQSLDAVFGSAHEQRPLIVGSVKTNVGHLEPAAGISGLLKVLLSLRHREIPAHLHLDNPSPHIPWDELRIAVPTERLPWDLIGDDELRRAGVSSFGFSGTNAHVVVEEAPRESVGGGRAGDGPVILKLAGKTEEARADLVAAWAEFAPTIGEADLASIACTANVGRADHAYRRAIVANDAADLARRLADLAADPDAVHGAHGHAPPHAPRVGWMFTGQGAQSPGMARGLYESQPVFRQVLDRCAAAFDELRDKPLLSVLWGDDTDLLSRTDYTQPALFAVEVALAETWRSYGVDPSAVLGHSVGEYAAAVVAGVFDLESGLRLIAARGRLMQERCERGSMVAVAAEEADVAPALDGYEGGVAIAALNGPASVVVSGETAAVAAITTRLESRGVRCTPLDVSHAFHSPMMEPIVERFREVAESISYRRPRCTFVSNLTGDVVDDEIATPGYWVRHVRSPVRFADGVAVLAHHADLMLEIGPRPTLCSMGRGCIDDQERSWLPSLRPGMDDRAVMFGSLAEIWVRGGIIDWAAVHVGERRSDAGIPRYPFQRQSYWLERGRGGNWRTTADLPLHPLLGTSLRLATLADGEALFESRISSRSPAWLSDHRVHGVAVVPAAAFLEMMLAAARATLGSGPIALVSGGIESPLVLDDVGRTVQTVVRPVDDGVAVKVMSLEGDEEDAQWVTHASSTVVHQAVEVDGPVVDLDDVGFDGDAVAGFYGAYEEIGLRYGSAFRVVTAIARSGETPTVRLQLPAGADVPGAVVHPVVLDGAFQSSATVLGVDGFDDAWLPVGVERLTVRRDVSGGATCRVSTRASEPGARVLVMDLELFDAAGRSAVSVSGLQLIRAPKEALLRGRDVVSDLLHEVQWVPSDEPDRPGAVEEGRWIVVSDEGDTEVWSDALRGHGKTCEPVRLGDLALDRSHLKSVLDQGGDGDGSWEGVLFVADVNRRAADAPEDRRRSLMVSLLHAIQATGGHASSRPPRLAVVTRGGAAVGDLEAIDPDHAAIWGVVACCALEHPALNPMRLDLGPEPESDEARRAVAVLLGSAGEDSVALRSDTAFVPRLAKVGVREEGGGLTRPQGPFELGMAAYGSFAGLEARPLVVREPEANEIRVSVVAAALNFKDVLFALGMLEDWSRERGIERAADQPLGFECAGRVVAVGADVDGFAVGDRVIATGEGCLASDVTVPAGRVVAMPEGLSFEDACALPTVFVTASYALETLAQLANGERVLIHAGAGGVGQAAIQLALSKGCEVFATASPPKHDHLRSQGVAHVMHSRTLEFRETTRAVTDGDGVDVVLNSLNGDAIPASIAATRKGGRFVDIGKIGAWTADQVAAERPDLSYWNFDMSDVAEADPRLYSTLLRDVASRVGSGELSAPPVTTFEFEDVQRAFSLLASGKHIGKVVVRMAREPAIRDDRTYLITGGYGALGLAAAERFVEAGARTLLLMARRAPGEEAAERIDALRAQGVTIGTEQADVASRDDIERVLGEVLPAMPPLGGVYHTAGVLADGMLMNQTQEAFDQVLAPKVRGLEILADVLDELGATPDWWCCTSSMVGLLGAAGQSPYAAANAWMDAWCQRRTARGNRAVSIAWGPWAGAGMAASVASRNEVRFAEMGLRTIDRDLGSEALMRALGSNGGHLAVLPIRWSRWMRQYRGRPPSMLAAFEAAGSDGGDARPAILDDLAAAADADREEILLGYLVGQLAGVLGWASTDRIETDRPFGDLGVDSLLAVDMRNRLETTFRVPLPATLLFDHPSLEALAAYLASAVLAEVGAPPESAGSAEAPAMVSDDLDDLSEEELARRLADQIERLDA